MYVRPKRGSNILKIEDKVKVIDESSQYCGKIGIIKSFFNNSGGEGVHIEFSPYSGAGLYLYRLKLVPLEPIHFCNPLCSDCMKDPRQAVTF